MPKYQAYWDGSELAQIELIPATVLRSNREDATRAMNWAFTIYYGAMQAAKAAEAANARAAGAMRAAVRDAATSGWGFGVKDLQDAFRHADANNGQWTDNKARHYGGALGQYSGWIPHAAANFFEAIEEKGAEARALAEEHEKAGGVLAAVVPAVGSPQWDQAGKALETLQSWNEKMEKYLWLIPVGLASSAASQRLAWTAEAFIEKVNEGNEVAGKFLSAASDTRAACDTFDSAMRAGFKVEEGILIAALEKVAGYLPVFGEAYAKAIAFIPAVAATFQSIAETRQQQMMLALYNAGRGQGMVHVGSTR